VGFCGIFEHFSGFGLFLLPNIFSARPKSANASRWATGHLKFKLKKCLAGGGPCSAVRFWVSRFFKSMPVCLLESFGNVRWLFGELLGALFCKPSLFGYVNWLTMQAKFFTLEFWFWANRFGV